MTNLSTGKRPMVYLGMTADVMHHGLINIIEAACKYGEVTIGLLTDQAIIQFKRLPYLNYEERKRIVLSIKGVAQVVPQEEWDYAPNLMKYKPDVMIHGDDWCSGVQRKFRDRAMEAVQSYGGKIVEIPYTHGVSSSKLVENARYIGTTPDIRLKSLRRLLESKNLVRLMEVHSPLTGLIVEKLRIDDEHGVHEFDGMWGSSLTASTMMGKPDIESISLDSRLASVNDIFEVTTKPMVFDADTGGLSEHLAFHVRTMERMGISAMIIEDKTGLKKNSLLGNEVDQTQDSIENFSLKIRSAKAAQVTDDFMVIARIESLILDQGMEDAVRRAKAYLASGADGIMIHSRRKSPQEILEFCKIYHDMGAIQPLVVVPTSYCEVYESQLAEAGVNVVIYANHLLRAAYPAMVETAKTILKNKRSFEAEKSCLSIKEILDLIPGTS